MSKPISSWRPRTGGMFVVAPASPRIWAVAFSRKVIPGALFSSQTAAVFYAFVLASGAGLDGGSVRILGAA